MTRFDRYVLFLFFRVLIVCFSSIVGLLVIVEVFTNLDEFMQAGKQQGSIARVLWDYFGPKTFSVFEYISGLLAMLAMMFVISWLYRTNELTALLAAGVTKRRVIRPLLIASAVVVAGGVLSREMAVPHFQDKLGRMPQDLTTERPQPVRPAYDWSLGAVIDGRSLLRTNRQVLDPIVRFSNAAVVKTVGKRIQAKTATRLIETDERPNGFMLSGVIVPTNIDFVQSVTDATGRTVLYTRHEYPWIESGNCFLSSELDFDLLRASNKRHASTRALVSHLQASRVTRGDDLRVSIHSRLIKPLVDWTVVLLGIPIVLSRPDRNVLWVAGVCLCLVAGFTAMVLGLNALSSAGYLISPFLAVWLPVVAVLPFSACKLAAACER